MIIWSKTHLKCTACGTIEKRHMARGLCVYCYLKQYHNDPKNVAKVKAQKTEHYKKKQKPRLKEKRDLAQFSGNRENVLVAFDYCCSSCKMKGTTTSLVVHHIDGNGRGSAKPNNTLSNLTPLCKKCHAAVHRAELLDARFHRTRDGWSKAFPSCVCCGTTELRHNSHGRCCNCHAAYQRSTKKI